VKRFAALTFGAVLVATAILAVLGYVSLRQWQRAAELLMREQARDMAAMAAEKIEMTVLKSEEESLGSLQRLLLDPDVRPAAIDEWASRTALVGRVYLIGRDGRVLHPPHLDAADEAVVAGLVPEISRGFWQRGGRRHFAVGDHVVLAAVLERGGREPVLAVLRRDDDALRKDVLASALGGLEGKSVLAVLDRADRPVYASGPLGDARPLLTVGFGETLPAWRVALYQPAGAAPRDAVRGQAMLFTAAFALLLVVIVLGLAATYRVVRRESEMARLKSDFVANVSHDLKTPLSLIRMFGETLEMGRVADEGTRREYYGVITRESERLTRLIDNVLDFSRIEGGRQRYDFEPAPVEPLVHEVLDAFRHPLAERGFKVEVEMEPGLPEITVDAAAVKQALANLIDNAIKYSADRRRLAVSVRREGNAVAIDVADDGVGIPVSERQRIFEKFYRVGRSETQGRRGSGVGLALVKHIAEAHGGDVLVDSRPGEGSRFSIRLPLDGPEGSSRS